MEEYYFIILELGECYFTVLRNLNCAIFNINGFNIKSIFERFILTYLLLNCFGNLFRELRLLLRSEHLSMCMFKLLRQLQKKKLNVVITMLSYHIFLLKIYNRFFPKIYSYLISYHIFCRLKYTTSFQKFKFKIYNNFPQKFKIYKFFFKNSST